MRAIKCAFWQQNVERRSPRPINFKTLPKIMKSTDGRRQPTRQTIPRQVPKSNRTRNRLRAILTRPRNNADMFTPKKNHKANTNDFLGLFHALVPTSFVTTMETHLVCTRQDFRAILLLHGRPITLGDALQEFPVCAGKWTHAAQTRKLNAERKHSCCARWSGVSKARG